MLQKTAKISIVRHPAKLSNILEGPEHSSKVYDVMNFLDILRRKKGTALKPCQLIEY